MPRVTRTPKTIRLIRIDSSAFVQVTSLAWRQRPADGIIIDCRLFSPAFGFYRFNGKTLRGVYQ